MKSLEIGTKLLQYRVLEVLGAGGFGITYLAKDESLDKLFAIKEYCPEEFSRRQGVSVRAISRSADDFQWGLQRFLEEARSLALFRHNNIVGVTQIFELNNTAYIVLEYQSGESLKSWIQKFSEGVPQAPLDLLMRAILDAVSTIHKNNLLHRDLAPDNIYVRDDGSPVILDFGSAREAVAARSRTISAVVKSGYSPAEQYSTRGTGQGPWSDIYALAATLYFCVARSAPEEATERIIADTYCPAVECAKGEYRRTFLEAIDWGLKIAPKDRPQSVEEWAKKLLDGEPVVGSGLDGQKSSGADGDPQAHPPKGVLPWVRNPRVLATGAVCLLLVAVGIGSLQNERLLVWVTTRKAADESRKAVANTPLSPGALPVRPPTPATAPAESRPDPAAIRQNALAIIKLLAIDDLCRKALDGGRWSDASLMRDHVEEAIRRGFSSEGCRRIVDPKLVQLAALPVKTICSDALNGNATDWHTDISHQDNVAEAKRRGLTIADCRKITVIEPAQRPAEQAARTEQPQSKGPMMLGIDRVLENERNWTIGFNQSLGGCVASASHADGTKMWFGYAGAQDSAYVAFSNPKWASIIAGGTYNLQIDFGNGHKGMAVFGGILGLGEKGIFRIEPNMQLFDYITKLTNLGLYLEGKELARIPLNNFIEARTKASSCQIAYRRNRGN